ncbi:MAG: DUF1016 N-terminal domain-containing protein, partial [Saprospiraceae bacterium]|nr:DUF1016 N-terminal domain-containing protein [Saprospiraceae bacterium]
MAKEFPTDTYGILLSQIGETLTTGRRQAYQAVNTSLLKTYWEIGRHIVEYEQKGNEKAEYGSHLLDRLARDLKERHGNGFTRTNVVYIRKLYLIYPIGQTL